MTCGLRACGHDGASHERRGSHRRVVDDAVDDHVGDVIAYLNGINGHGGDLPRELPLTREFFVTPMDTYLVIDHLIPFIRGLQSRQAQHCHAN
jgi:hypothetical protein